MYFRNCGAYRKESKNCRKSVLPSKKQKIRSKSSDKKFVSHVQRRCVVQVNRLSNNETNNWVANRENDRSRRRQQSAPLLQQQQSRNNQSTTPHRLQSVSRTSGTIRVNTAQSDAQTSRRASHTENSKSSAFRVTRSSGLLTERELRPRVQLS